MEDWSSLGRYFRQGQLEVVKLTIAVISSPMALKSEIGVGGWHLCSAFASRACLDGNSRKGSGCQQRVESASAWLEVRSCRLGGPMRGSMRSHLELQAPLDFLR